MQPRLSRARCSVNCDIATAYFRDALTLDIFYNYDLRFTSPYYSMSLQLFPSSHREDLRVGIVVVSDQRKSTPSSDGMKRSVKTSALLRHRADVVVPTQLKALRSAIADRDFDDFAEVTMKESNSLHAVCLDTFPPLKYLNRTSHDIVDLGNVVRRNS